MLALEQLLNPAPGSSNRPPSLCELSAYRVEHNVPFTRETTLESVFYYAKNTLVEYPQTSSSSRTSVAHVFERDSIDVAFQPERSIVYSRGKPTGYKKDRYCQLLKGADGKPVPCTVSTTTCQGIKACPFVNQNSIRVSHTQVSHSDIHTIVKDRLSGLSDASPQQALFQKTAAYYTAVTRVGCPGPPMEETRYTAEEQEARQVALDLQASIHRGGKIKPTCDGRIVLDSDNHGTLYLRRIEQVETDAFSEGYGPLVECQSVLNFSCQKIDCDHEHRDEDTGFLRHWRLEHHTCHCKFAVWKPLAEYDAECPYVVVISSNKHRHIPPLPMRTPINIRADILQLMKSLEVDLPDLTPRGFLRHPTVKTFLRNRIPNLAEPLISDLHPSLSNRDHLRAYLRDVQRDSFPQGTGWESILHAKHIQDNTVSRTERYIRTIQEVPLKDGSTFRFIICMKPQQTALLKKSNILQSDISFKRVVGFEEFAVGGRHPSSSTVLAFCRIYLTCGSAEAHHIIFNAIDDLVLEDTGSRLEWRHIHGRDVDDFCGVWLWGGDQHGGQAKGLGLHLQQRAQESGLRERHDHFDTDRHIGDLTPYEHVHRVFRLCYAHFMRNITEGSLPDHVKAKMRSLACITHPDFEGTLAYIKHEGGKAGADWVADKIRSKFALEGLCWERSKIPLTIWKAGEATTNIVEGLHCDVNRKGRDVAYWEVFAIDTWETTGIAATQTRKDSSYSTARNLKRKFASRHRDLLAQDERIESANAKIQKTHRDLDKAQQELWWAQQGPSQPRQLERLQKDVDKMREAYKSAIARNQALIRKGTGRRVINNITPFIEYEPSISVAIMKWCLTLDHHHRQSDTPNLKPHCLFQSKAQYWLMSPAKFNSKPDRGKRKAGETTSRVCLVQLLNRIRARHQQSLGYRQRQRDKRRTVKKAKKAGASAAQPLSSAGCTASMPIIIDSDSEVEVDVEVDVEEGNSDVEYLYTAVPMLDLTVVKHRRVRSGYPETQIITF
ncbi:hypothetical protein BDZ89DRAFT_1119143 [Hymenopellis radicata]|nr:hypothetical protein BDZ89DRAFT_1119143 [Hymenopellis radicata]